MEAAKRSEINRALAKAIAYRDCGKDSMARAWAAKLVHLLECEAIVTTRDGALVMHGALGD